VHRDDQRVRAEPFEAIELELALLWDNIAARPFRASELEPENAYAARGTMFPGAAQ